MRKPARRSTVRALWVCSILLASTQSVTAQSPVSPAPIDRSSQDSQDRKLQFEGRWSGSLGWTEFDSGTIRSDGVVLGKYSVVAHEESFAIIEIISDLYYSKYWRLDWVAPRGLDITMYANMDDALTERSERGRLHYYARYPLSTR